MKKASTSVIAPSLLIFLALAGCAPAPVTRAQISTPGMESGQASPQASSLPEACIIERMSTDSPRPMPFYDEAIHLSRFLPRHRPDGSTGGELIVASRFCVEEHRDGNTSATAESGPTPSPFAPTEKGGIGAELTMFDEPEAVAEFGGNALITGTIQGGPADTAGLRAGDVITAVTPEPGKGAQPLSGLSPQQVLALITGPVGTRVGLTLAAQDDGAARQVTLTRADLARVRAAAEKRKRQALVIQGNTGQYMSPYTSDGVVAEWVNKAINAEMGGAAGSAVGAAAGAYAGQKLMENVPGGSMLGGLFGGVAGSKAGEAAGRNTAVEASGGMEHIRATSDLSFRSIDDMARWLVNVHGNKANFTEVVNAATQIYPQLKQAVAKAHQ